MGRSPMVAATPTMAMSFSLRPTSTPRRVRCRCPATPGGYVAIITAGLDGPNERTEGCADAPAFRSRIHAHRDDDCHGGVVGRDIGSGGHACRRLSVHGYVQI